MTKTVAASRAVILILLLLLLRARKQGLILVNLLILVSPCFRGVKMARKLGRSKGGRWRARLCQSWSSVAKAGEGGESL